MELSSLTLTEATRLVAKRKISPVELAMACIRRIEDLNPRLNCFITITDELAIEQAKVAEIALLQGKKLPPMHGMPVALKDLFETKGILTTAGSKFFAGNVPQANAFAVEMLYNSGVVMLGKLNLHEIALGVTNVNPYYGACHNPWNPERISGGSSGGSAAALSAGLCLGSLGSDTGGSIRIPASLCGVVGLKPTYGRVSLRGVMPLSWSLDHAGPMGRCVQDVAILLQAIAGYDPHDPSSVNIPVEDYLSGLESGVKDWRVALTSDEYFSQADDQVLKSIGEAAEVFESLGAQVTPVELSGMPQATQANVLIIQAEAAVFHRDRVNSKPQDFDADVLQRLRTGASYTVEEYVLARRSQTELRRKFEGFFDQYDILLTPTTPVAAPPILGPDAVEQARLLTCFTAPFNLTGLPAISLPCGFTRTGLPIGLQIIARPWAEKSVLRAAYSYEQAAGWHLRRPPL